MFRNRKIKLDILYVRVKFYDNIIAKVQIVNN
jgi:hypothetical protein